MKRIGFEDNFVFSCGGEFGKRVFDCRDEIGHLWGVEKMLEIADRNMGDISKLNFFEFGSAQFNIFNKIPMSGKVSHFMMFGTNLNYFCFDSEIGCNDFDLVFEVVNLHKKIISGDFISDDEIRLKQLLDSYAEICRKKDFPVPFVYEALAEEIPSLGVYYNLDLNKLKLRIKKSSFMDYHEMLSRVGSLENNVIFSLNVLNSPNLSLDYTFWNVEGVFHIHGVNEVELLSKMKLSKYFEDKADKRGLVDLGISVEEFISKFRKMFGVNNEVYYEDGFFYWKS